jgi:hypothetical protein
MTTRKEGLLKGANRDIRKLAGELKPGWHIEAKGKRSNHLRVYGPDGEIVVLPSSTNYTGVAVAKKLLRQRGAL